MATTEATLFNVTNISRSIENTTDEVMTTLFPELIASTSLWIYVGMIIIILGSCGHILSIVVLLWSTKMRKASSTVYLIAMSFAGLVTLYTGLLRYHIVEITNKDTDLRNDSIFACRFHLMLTYLSLQYFAWLQATVAVDRLLSLLLPHKYKTLCTWKSALAVTLIELVLVTSLNSSIAITSYHDEDGYCVGDDYYLYEVWGYIDLVSFSLLPAVIMIICNFTILYIFKTSKTIQQKSKSSKSRSLTLMLVSLNVIFLVTTVPISVIFFLNWDEYGTLQYAKMELAWTIFSLLQYMGSACTFLVYCITGSKFREEFVLLLKAIFVCRSSRISSMSQQTNATVLQAEMQITSSNSNISQRPGNTKDLNINNNVSNMTRVD